MNIQNLHAWDLNEQEAIRLQGELRQRVIVAWEGRPINTIGGVDCSIQGESTIRCAITVFQYPGLAPIESSRADVPLTFPYIPGLLAFREGPAVLAAWERLSTHPDLLMFDGQGIAHPRRLGIASLMGLWLQIPTIGVAKSRLFGRHAEPGPDPGDREVLYDPYHRNQVIGMVLRTRLRSKPLYISPGHLIDVPHALEFVLACGRGYRLPEPTRWAHLVAGGTRFPSSGALFP